jgi:hypothetical protein
MRGPITPKYAGEFIKPNNVDTSTTPNPLLIGGLIGRRSK